MLTGRALAAILLAMTGGCAQQAHIVAAQSTALAPQPRTLGIAVDAEAPLAFGLDAKTAERAAKDAGFVLIQSGRMQYRLYLSAAVHPSKVGGLIPSASPEKGHDSWFARPHRSLLGGRNVARVTAVLIDVPHNREVWRATAWRRTGKASASVPALAASLLAKLPRA